MEKKAVSGIMLTLLLVGMLSLAFNIQPVKSEPTTIIVPDNYAKIQWAIGNASDGDTIFVRAGTYYEHVVVNKTVSLIGENRSTTIIDGNRTWDPVIRIVADNVTITGFTLQSGGPYGIGLYLCENARGNVVYGNIISNNADGILIWSSNNNTVFNNLITSNWIHGLLLAYSVNNTLKSNNLTENPYNFGVMGNLLEHFIHNLDISNTVNGKPIYYWVNQADKQIPIDAGYVGIINSTHITVKDLALTNNWQGILLAYTTNSIIHNVNITSSWKGIYLYNQDAYGNNTISNNILFNDAWGIELSRSSGNAIKNNKITSNNELYGICLDSSNANAISGNNISNFRIGLHLGYSDNNTIMGNSIANSRTYGIRSYNSSRNIIYHNNFINNTQQVYIESYHNIWDDGYPSGGNYWSDHVCTGNPSDGSQPYTIDVNNIDHYPFQDPNGWHLSKGDVNFDGTVNIFDLRICAKAFGSKTGGINWNPIVDLNQDGIIDIFDLRRIAKHYLEHV